MKVNPNLRETLGEPCKCRAPTCGPSSLDGVLWLTKGQGTKSWESSISASQVTHSCSRRNPEDTSHNSTKTVQMALSTLKLRTCAKLRGVTGSNRGQNVCRAAKSEGLPQEGLEDEMDRSTELLRNVCVHYQRCRTDIRGIHPRT